MAPVFVLGRLVAGSPVVLGLDLALGTPVVVLVVVEPVPDFLVVVGTPGVVEVLRSEGVLGSNRLLASLIFSLRLLLDRPASRS